MAETRAHSRVASEDRRTQLLERVADHILEHGVAAVPLRGLARAAGSNNRMLLYYFGSRANLLLEAMQTAGRRFERMDRVADRLAENHRSLRERLDRAWAELGAAENLPFIRLFFHVLGLASFVQRAEWEPVLGRLDSFMVAELTATMVHDGVGEHSARIIAKQTLALWRGLQIMQVALAPRTDVERVREAGHQAIVIQVGQLSRGT